MFKAFTLALALVLALPLMAHAEDTPFVRLLGFNSSGSRMAFQESYILDGSGGYYSIIRVLDTVNDKYIDSAKAEIIDGDSPAQTFASFVTGLATKNTTVAMLNKYDIKSSRGTTVHVSTAPRISSFTYANKYLSFMLSEKAVNITADNGSAERLETCSYFEGAIPEPGSLLGYTLTAFNSETTTHAVLDDDTRVPTSRGCPLGYTISNAFAYSNTVVVLVAVHTQGFEGPDVGYITVPFDIRNF